MNFLQRTPFLRLLIPVVIGILSYQHLQLPVAAIFFLYTVSVTMVAVALLIRPVDTRYRLRWLFGLGITLFFIVLSHSLCSLQAKRNAFDHAGENGIFLVELTKLPTEKPRSYLCEVKTIQFTDSLHTTPSRGKAYVYLEKDSIVPTLAAGDYLLLKGTFNEPSSLNNPDGFDYASYLMRKGIGATTYVPHGNWTLAGHADNFSIERWSRDCQKQLLDLLRQFDFSQENFAVLAALSFGYTDELDPDLRQRYSISGITHILAVSGLHVGIIYFILHFLLQFFDRFTFLRKFKIFIILTLLWIYAFITGLSPSAFRATLMFSFVAIGNLLGKKASIYNTLSMSAFFMLLINPNLLFHIGFQLSYTAVAGIVYFQPRLARLFTPRNRPARWLWNLLTVSLAAQIGTVPLTLYYFHTFPNYFLFTNMIAIPATTLILYLTVCLLVFSSIPYLAGITALLLDKLLTLLNSSVHLVQQLPHPTSVIAFNGYQSLLLVLSVAFLCHYARSRKYGTLICGLSCMAGMLAIDTVVSHRTAHTEKLIVYASYRDTHVNFISGYRNYVYTSEPGELHKTAHAFWNLNKINAPALLPFDKGQDACFTFHNRKILIPTTDFYNRHTSTVPLHVDYLIIGHGLKPRANELLECIRPQHIITDHTITPWYTRQLQQACKENNIAFHSTRDQGAFVMEFR